MKFKREIDFDLGLYGFGYIYNYMNMNFSVLKLGIVCVTWMIKEQK